MNRELLARRYGFGAARVCLCPPPHRTASEHLTLLAAVRLAGGELAGDATLRRTLTLAPAGVAALALLLALATTLARERRDVSDVELVLRRAPPPAEDAPAVPEPPAPPVTIASVEPARAPAPPPAPTPQIEKPPVAPPVAEPKPAPTPALVANPVAPTRVAERPARERPAPEPRTPPRPSIPRPVAVARAELPAAAEPVRARRSQPTPTRPQHPVAPVSVQLDAPAEEGLTVASARTGRSSRPAPTATPRSRSLPRPALDAPAAAASPAAIANRVPARSRRGGPRPARSGAPSRPASLAPPAPATRVAAAGSAALPRPPARPGVAPPPAAPARSRRSQDDAQISGVPLGQLASCVSDREEDALKRRVVATVSSPAACTSKAGRYHFIETRNLNAFLMSIERSPSRPVADRCTELTLALECLARQSSRADRDRRAGGARRAPRG